VTREAAVGTDGAWIRTDVRVFASVGKPIADERTTAALGVGAVGTDGIWVAAAVGLSASAGQPIADERTTAVVVAAAVGTDSVWIAANTGVYASVATGVGAFERATAVSCVAAVGTDGHRFGAWIAASGRIYACVVAPLAEKRGTAGSGDVAAGTDGVWIAASSGRGWT